MTIKDEKLDEFSRLMNRAGQAGVVWEVMSWALDGLMSQYPDETLAAISEGLYEWDA